MQDTRIPRRRFLKATTQALAAAPLLAAAPFALAEPASKPPAKSPAKSPDITPFAPASPAVVLNPRDLGALGDGTTKDTVALQLAIERASVLGGGEVAIPAGTYLTGALFLRSNVTLRLAEGAELHGSPDMADYPLAMVRWEGRWIKGYIGFISAADAENIAILGPGRIVASDAIKGRVLPGNVIGTDPSGRPLRDQGLRLPALLEFVNCRNVLVQDLHTVQTGMWSTHPVLSQNVTFKNVVFKSGADGIDVDSCQHVLIDTCDFDTADDCISLKSGRGAEAASQIGTNPRITCDDIHITNCTFVDHNFACIGIGSEISGGIRNARIDKCKFNGARSHAIYIKSRVGRGAFIENISVTDCDVSGMQAGFLSITNIGSGKSDEFNVPGDAGIAAYRNFSFTNIRVTGVPHLVEAINMHPTKPLDGFTLSNITGTAQKGIAIANMKNVHLADIKVTGVEGPLLSTLNVTGTGLAGAVPIPTPPKLLDPIPTPAQRYKLH